MNGEVSIVLLRYLPILALTAIIVPNSISIFTNTSGFFAPKRDDSSLQASAEKSKYLSKGSLEKNLLQELELNQAQQQQIEQIRSQYQQAMVRRQKNLHSAQQELINMMIGTDATDVIRTQQQQVVRLRQEIGELRFESMLAIREILTPEQRQKFAQIMRSNRENPKR